MFKAPLSSEHSVDTMLTQYFGCLAFLIVVPAAWSIPLNRDGERGPLAAVSELNSAVSGLESRVAARLLPADRDPRLPLPSPQDLDTIRKVAQILVMIGEQVLPSILDKRPPSSPSETQPPQDIPNDPVKE